MLNKLRAGYNSNFDLTQTRLNPILTCKITSQRLEFSNENMKESRLNLEAYKLKTSRNNGNYFSKKGVLLKAFGIARGSETFAGVKNQGHTSVRDLYQSPVKFLFQRVGSKMKASETKRLSSSKTAIWLSENTKI